MQIATNTAELAARTLGDPRWSAVLARDAKSDERFWYSVKTTGVYCRPSCAARPARPENVAFHTSRAEAEAAGFRPCKRCKPDQPPRAAREAALVAALCRHIEQAEQPPSLDELAVRAQLSPHHLHRLFKQHTGLTPRAYAEAHRSQRLRSALAEKGSVTEAIYDAGYNASSRFYEQSGAVLGMTPRAFRGGGVAEEIRFAIAQCSLGAILVAATARGVCAILLGDDAEALLHDLQDRFPKAQLLGGDDAFDQLVARVVGLVEAPRTGSDLPLDIRGTAFQQRVWQVLREIPAGATASYAEVATRMGEPKAVRAVAQACGANALAVAIPCHRVVKSDGAISGYRWGVERKRELLARESRA